MRNTIRERFVLWSSDGRLYAVLAACGFSMKAIFVKLAYAAGAVDPAALLVLRMGFALPLFLWLLRRSGGDDVPRLSGIDIAQVWLLGCTGYYLSSLFDFKGLAYVTAGLERLILYIYPTLVLLLQAWLTRQRPARRAWQAMGICYLGLAIAFAHDLHQHGQGANVLVGAAWVFASAVTYALYYIGTGKLVGRLGSARLAGLSGSASCVLVMAHFVVFGRPQVLAGLPLDHLRHVFITHHHSDHDIDLGPLLQLAWLSGLARWLRGPSPVPAEPRWWQRPHMRRAAFWGGLVVLLMVSCALEWRHDSRSEAAAPSELLTSCARRRTSFS